MTKGELDGFKGCALLLFLPFGIALLSALNGWGLMVLWNWFAVDAFGLARLGIVNAIGVAMLVGYLTNHQHKLDTKKDPDVKWWHYFAIAAARPVLSVACGWLLRWVTS